jgi:hypothetical protein
MPHRAGPVAPVRRLARAVETANFLVHWGDRDRVVGVVLSRVLLADDDWIAGADVDIDVAVRAEGLGVDYLAVRGALTLRNLDMLGTNADGLGTESRGDLAVEATRGGIRPILDANVFRATQHGPLLSCCGGIRLRTLD